MGDVKAPLCNECATSWPVFTIIIPATACHQRHDVERYSRFTAMQLHLKVSGVDAFSHALRVWLTCQHILIRALVPDVHQAGPILPCWDFAAEVGILEGVVL